MSDELIVRHEKFRNYLRGISKNVDRGKYWTELSPEFDAKLNETGFLNINKSNYLPGIVGRDEKVESSQFVEARSAFSLAMSSLLGENVSVESISDVIQINNNEYYIAGERSGMLFGNRYTFERIKRSNIKPIKKYLEIGGGSGFLSSLLREEYNCQVVIVDLPEMLTVSSAFLMHTFPDKKFLLANELEDAGDYSQYDFILITPDNLSKLEECSFDFILNKASFMEMDLYEVNNYFSIVDKYLMEGGAFYCSNRPVKRTVMFDYPWSSQYNYKDLYFELNRYKVHFPNEFLDRCRIKGKGGCFNELSERKSGFLKGKYKKIRNFIWDRRILIKYPALANIRNKMFDFIMK